MDYDDIFNKAIKEVSEAWKIIGDGVFNGDVKYCNYLGDWNLDSGKDSNNNFVFWT